MNSYIYVFCIADTECEFFIQLDKPVCLYRGPQCRFGPTECRRTIQYLMYRAEYMDVTYTLDFTDFTISRKEDLQEYIRKSITPNHVKSIEQMKCGQYKIAVVEHDRLLDFLTYCEVVDNFDLCEDIFVSDEESE